MRKPEAKAAAHFPSFYFPLWPDAQPCDTWLFVAVAAAVVWINREAMFSRHMAITDVIPK